MGVSPLPTLPAAIREEYLPVGSQVLHRDAVCISLTEMHGAMVGVTQPHHREHGVQLTHEDTSTLQLLACTIQVRV